MRETHRDDSETASPHLRSGAGSIARAPDGQIGRDGGDGAASDGASAAAAVPIHRLKKPLRRKINFLNQIKLICPVQSPSKKYFCFSEAKSPLYSRHPVPLKGAYHDRRETRGGVRWTRVALLTRALSCGRRSRVVLTPRRWCQVGGSNSAGDGGQKARAPGSARIIRKPLRGECRVIPV